MLALILSMGPSVALHPVILKNYLSLFEMGELPSYAMLGLGHSLGKPRMNA